MQPKLLLLSTLLSLPMLLQAQNQSAAFTLEQSLAYAMRNSPLVSNARIDTEIARKKVAETTALGLPQISGSLSFQNFIDIPTQVIPANAFNPAAPADELVPVKFGTDFNTTASLTASQLIFDGAYIVGLQAAKTYKELSRENLQRTEAEVKEQVSQAYYTAVIMSENLKVLQSSFENVTRLRKEMELIRDAGMAEEQDVEQLQLTEKGIENVVSRTQRQADLSLSLLKLNMGMPLDSQLVLVFELDNATSFLPPSGVDTTFNPESHYAMRTAMTSQQLMKLNLRKERYAYLPSLNAFITHQQNALRNDFDFFEDKPWYPSTVWGINLNLPIFDSGIKGARIGQARLEYEKSGNLVELTRSQLQLQAQAKRADLLSAADRFGNEKENLNLAERIYQKTLIKYKEGLATSLELNQAQTQLLNTQGSYINSALEMLNARVAFEKALGN